MRKFNVTGLCVPNRHYMVDISEKVEKIFKLIEDELYFTINRGRQYGKTTTIGMLEKRLPDDYLCASLSFQFSSQKMYADEAGFCQEFLYSVFESLENNHPDEAKEWVDKSVTDFKMLSRLITNICKNSQRKIVLIIDEADEASNNSIFIMFIKMLRDKFLMRNLGKDYTFHSVILAGVYDIRNLRQNEWRMQNGECRMEETNFQNSPWNIAADFKIDMSFSAKEIETMLVDYEKDHHTGMNISEIAQEIRYYTSGYPYLVSRICLLIETELDRNWTLEGVQKAIKKILREDSTLFGDMFKKIEENQDLRQTLFDLTVGKIKYDSNIDNPAIKIGVMFGFLARDTDMLQVHNKIFEIRITNYFISMNTLKWREQIIQPSENEIIKNNIFDMELCLTKFKTHYAEIYTTKDLKFLERDGKLLFLTYLKPLINNTGFYHFESETRDQGRIDMVIDYLKQQFILEMKLCYGKSRHEEAYQQLADYLKSKNMDRAYLLTYDFRQKGDDSLSESQWIDWDGKRIFDVVLRVGEVSGLKHTQSR